MSPDLEHQSLQVALENVPSSLRSAEFDAMVSAGITKLDRLFAVTSTGSMFIDETSLRELLTLASKELVESRLEVIRTQSNGGVKDVTKSLDARLVRFKEALSKAGYQWKIFDISIKPNDSPAEIKRKLLASVPHLRDEMFTSEFYQKAIDRMLQGSSTSQETAHPSSATDDFWACFGRHAALWIVLAVVGLFILIGFFASGATAIGWFIFAVLALGAGFLGIIGEISACLQNPNR